MRVKHRFGQRVLISLQLSIQSVFGGTAVSEPEDMFRWDKFKRKEVKERLVLAGKWIARSRVPVYDDQHATIAAAIVQLLGEGGMVVHFCEKTREAFLQHLLETAWA